MPLYTSVVGTLSIAGSSKLNLNRHTLLVDYTGTSPYVNLIRSPPQRTGYNGGTRDGQRPD